MNVANLICLKHQEYDGTTPPTLSCKTCCYIFVGRLRDQVAKKKLSHQHRGNSENPSSKDLKNQRISEKFRVDYFPDGI